MKKNKISLKIIVSAAALTMILSNPYCAIAQKNTSNSTANTINKRGYFVNVDEQAPGKFKLIPYTALVRLH